MVAVSGQCDAFRGVHQAEAALAESPCSETGIGSLAASRVEVARHLVVVMALTTDRFLSI